MRGNHPQTSPPHPGHPGRSAAESRDLSPVRIGSISPHPEEQTRLGLRLEGRGWRWPRWRSLLESLVLRDAMRSRMAPQDEGVNPEASPLTPVIPAGAQRRAGILSREGGTSRAWIPGQARDDGEMVEAGEMADAGARGENS